MKQLKKIFLGILLISSFLPLIAQHDKTDSLYAVLKTAKNDTGKIKILSKLVKILMISGEYVKADSLAGEELAVSKLINNERGIAVALNQLGDVSNWMGKYTLGADYETQALKLFQKIGDKKLIANTYIILGWSHFNLGNNPQALDNFLKSEKFSEEAGDKHGLGAVYNQLGNFYYVTGDYNGALGYYNKSLKLAQELNYKYGVASAYGSIGNAYWSLKNYTEALKNEALALQADKESNYPLGEANTYCDVGFIYSDMQKNDEAFEQFKQALEIYNRIGSASGIATACIGQGTTLMHLKNYPEAKLYIDSALHVALNIADKTTISMAYYGLAKLDSINNDYKGAFTNYKMEIAYKDSISNEANTKKIVQEQMQYEFDKKQAEEKAEQDKKDAVTAADKKRQSIITASVSVVLLLVLAFSGLLFSRFRVTQKQKKVIEEQKVVVEEKNKEILDSITYAKRLQDAILPPLSIIEKYFPESFVLYKPKDIVAGDFYWMEHIPTPSLSSGGEGANSSGSFSPPVGRTQEGIVFIAAADCTGHGVPGAMVSVVCSNALNRAVKEFHITEPGKILDKTRELVLETFAKSEGNIQDGMDISLASLELRSHPSDVSKGGIQLQWAGAYNSLWMITSPNEGGKEGAGIVEVEGDKQPIGKTDNAKPFITHNITISAQSGGQRGALYLFTDGYADQFGGPKGKKFKYQQLKEKLSAISSKPMAEQKRILEETLESWQGDLEQTDDICIIGLRV